jgi:phosphatidylglycerol:prolipoprotein diacylglycerol transferase
VYFGENALLPYIHLGPLEIPTFGLLMVLAFAASYFALEAEIQRRKLAFTAADLAQEKEGKRRKLMKLDPYTVVAVVAFAGILGAKLWHIIDTPADRPTAEMLHSFGALVSWFRGGFAWFGGFVAGIAALLIIARQNGINMLTMLDLSSPAAAVGYAVGRIGCLISGDGDYGKPTTLPWGMAFPDGLVPTTQTCGQAIDALHPHGWPANCAVHPTPIYEFVACVLICWYIWRRAARPLAPGVIVGEFLVLFGLERFLVEFIRINPRILWGMSNAQVAALLTVLAGVVMLVVARSRSGKTNPVPKSAFT